MEDKYYTGMQILTVLNQCFEDGYEWLPMTERLAKQPSAITHCTRCQEWHPREATEYGFCVRFGQYTKQCDYCSYGK